MYAYPPGPVKDQKPRESVERWWEIPDDCPEVRVLSFDFANVARDVQAGVVAPPSAYVLSRISYDDWRRNDWADRPHP